MNLQMERKTALVLGASGGLGAAIATSLAAEGVRVVAAGRNEQALRQTVVDIEAAGGQATAFILDLSERDRIDPSITSIERMVGAVDILINNTGGPPPTPAAGQDPDVWTQHFQSMVLSVIALTDRVLPGMRSRKWGRVITSTSSGVVAPIPNLGMSNALRLTLLGWSKTLAREVAKDGVTCNVVVPGRIGTRRTAFLDEQRAKREGRSVQEVSADSCAAIPLGRYGDPREYADVVTFLASGRASYVNGSVLRVDGGMIQSL
jgi:3-oxoacyl-[acyl-carrier protein] reductase